MKSTQESSKDTYRTFKQIDITANVKGQLLSHPLSRLFEIFQQKVIILIYSYHDCQDVWGQYNLIGAFFGNNWNSSGLILQEVALVGEMWFVLCSWWNA